MAYLQLLLTEIPFNQFIVVYCSVHYIKLASLVNNFGQSFLYIRFSPTLLKNKDVSDPWIINKVFEAPVLKQILESYYRYSFILEAVIALLIQNIMVFVKGFFSKHYGYPIHLLHSRIWPTQHYLHSDHTFFYSYERQVLTL